MSKLFVTRFAPSPSGHLHLGHAYSALLAYKAAQENSGRFLLRIEDIDLTRCRPEFKQSIYDDLAWLGLKWERPVRCQSEYFDDYQKAIHALEMQRVFYPCFCTRKDIAREIAESGRAPHGPDGPLYPGTCRKLPRHEANKKIEKGVAYALRLDVEKAFHLIMEEFPGPLTFFDRTRGEVQVHPELLGDVVIARKDVMASYHLSVVVDDHLQGITHIIRGEDLFHSTHIHRLLQALLGYETPKYHHHVLLAGKDGKRFAKRNRALTLQTLREASTSLQDVADLMVRHGAEIHFDLPLSG